MLTFILNLFLGASFGLLLSDYKPYTYEVRFTNPVCSDYRYNDPVTRRDGTPLAGKPKDAFCMPADEAASQDRPESPHTKLVDWIRDPATTEIFFAFLSFSNDSVSKEICTAIQERNVKVRFILDATTSQKEARDLMACQPQDENRKPEFWTRGGKNGLGFAHIKLFMINPHDPITRRIAFGSGNLTTGISLHHENWHFITTAAASHFAQAHTCVMQGMMEHGETRKGFARFMSECRAGIKAPVENDIAAFFVPGEGTAAAKELFRWIEKSSSISLAAHRFSFSKLFQNLGAYLDSGRPLRLLLDDDIFWAGKGQITGANTRLEFRKTLELLKKGAKVRYVETNHWNRQFQHNKFLIFETPQGEDAVFTGAGNLTGTAFSENFENFYLISNPKIVSEFKNQYRHMWETLATTPEDMPKENVRPARVAK